MPTTRRLNRPSILVLTAALAALAACQKGANTASTNPADAAPPLAAMALTNDSTLPPPAPATTALPPAPPIRTARLAGPPTAGYAYVDRAYEVNHGFGDAPPDYGFDYDGGQPWAWRSDDGYERVDEPVSGGDRDYYYEPNSDEPFLVRDDDYSYGYRGGILVIVYDREGRPLPAGQYDRYSDRAARLFYRARALHDAERRQPHHGVGRTSWQQRRDAMISDRQAWSQQQQSNADWRAYHDQTAPQDAAFDAMRARREAEATRVDQALQDRQAETRDQQAAQRAQAAVQARAQAQGVAPGGFRPPAPPSVSGPPRQATGPLTPAPQGPAAPVSGPPRQVAGPLAPSQGPTAPGPRPGPGHFNAPQPVNAGAAQARLQAQQAAAASRGAAASQAQANAQAAAQRQAETQAAAAKTRSDALARQQAAQQGRVQAQQQTAVQAQARAQALAQQQQQAAAQRSAQQAAAAQQRAQALTQQQAQLKARQATQQQTAADAQARAQAAQQQRQQAQAAAQQQRQAAMAARKAAAAAQAAANAKAKAETSGQPAPK